MKCVTNISLKCVPMLRSFEPCWKITAFCWWCLSQRHYSRTHLKPHPKTINLCKRERHFYWTLYLSTVETIACGISRLSQFVSCILRRQPCFSMPPKKLPREDKQERRGLSFERIWKYPFKSGGNINTFTGENFLHYDAILFKLRG